MSAQSPGSPDTRPFLVRHRALRWLAPLGVVGVVAVTAAALVSSKGESATLTDTTPAALLADVNTSPATGFSGTVVAQLSLGLPTLPGATGADDASMTSLLSGSHTLRVWYGGPQRQRVALLGTTAETDVFHDGTQLWQWDSNDHVATHLTLPPPRSGRDHESLPTDVTSLAPAEIANRALAALDPTTVVTVGSDRVVADRSAYDLVLTPRTRATRVGSVHIAVDGATKVPLAVQVYARGADKPAVDVAFSDISFRTPSASHFSFTPPPGVRVVERSVPSALGASALRSQPTVIGTGWSAIVQTHLPSGRASMPDLPWPALPHVSGSWGSGRLLDAALGCALVTDDGRVFVGAVDPAALYSAAATHR